jgi:hypothetical protein
MSLDERDRLPESAADRRRLGRQMAVDALVRRTLATGAAAARGAEIRREVRRRHLWRFAWRTLAAAAAIFLAAGIYVRFGKSSLPGAGDDRTLAAAAAKAKTVADLRPLAPQIRAASERMAAQAAFDPRRVMRLEFSAVAAEMARADWQVEAPALCIRLALDKAPEVVADRRIDLFPSAVAAESWDEWNTSFAQGLRSWHQGHYQDAAWTFTQAKRMSNASEEDRQRWYTTTLAMLLLQYQHPEALDNTGRGRYDATAIARNNLDWLFGNSIDPPTPLDERDLVAMWIVTDCLEHGEKRGPFRDLLTTASRPLVIIGVEQRLKRSPENEMTACVRRLYERAQADWVREGFEKFQPGALKRQ